MTDDRALISRIQSGDKQAFMHLIKLHERLVAHMIGRIVKDSQDCEELCQDVFLKVFEKLGEFSFQSRLSTWIATIAYRQGINHLRKQKIAYRELPDGINTLEQFVEMENPEEILSEKDMEKVIMELVDQLPVHYRTVLTLYHVEGMNYAEIGSVTDMPEGTVKNYLFRARAMMKEKVTRYLGKEEVL